MNLNAVGLKNFFIERYQMISNKGVAPHRFRGVSLSIALEIVSKCLRNPNEWQDYNDHASTQEARKKLLGQIMDCVEQLGLQGFYYSKKEDRFMFDLAQTISLERKPNGMIRIGD